MTLNKKMRLVLSATITALTCISMNSNARPNGNTNTHRTAYDKNLRTTASCKEATAAIDLDINNVRARLMTGGDMWWNIGIGEASYEVPKGTKKSSLFAGSVWIGGYDPQGQLKVAAQTYRQDGNDYWPGPLSDPGNDITAPVCLDWDKFWKVNKADVLAFRDLVAKGQVTTAINDPRFEDIVKWPGKGNGRATGVSGGSLGLDLSYSKRSYAPFVDADNDGNYDPEKGDYPDIFGDQYIWWVFNDKGSVKQQTKTDAIGLEVQASAFAFSRKDALNDATFYRYRLINRSNLSLDSAYISTWSDADLGYAFDDYIGCDTQRGLGILYNGNSVDGTGQINSYGTQIPMVGLDFFEGPKRYYTIGGLDTFEKLGMKGFFYYNNDFTSIGNPSNGQQIYGYMTGTIISGQKFSFDWDGIPGHTSKAYGTGPVTKFVYYGDPGNTTEWSECTCNNLVGDRRFIHSAGPFKLEAGSATNGKSQNDVTIGAVWTPNAGGCPNTSFKKIRAADDLAQDLFDSGFKTVEGPEAPRMVIREMDRKLVFYLLNDPIGNNYMEKFGRDDSLKYHAASVKTKKHNDSLYKFEGYRVFQLKNSEIQSAQIFNEDGSVNNSVAIEVFECDIHNGIGTIINWNKTDLGNGNDSTWVPNVKVNGKDSGIVHSFAIGFDAFATGTDKRLVNYRNYYFAAISYAYNDFGAVVSLAGSNVPSFNQSTKATAEATQDAPYIASDHGQGGIPIPAVAAMPNPSNGNMGTVLNADYGTGVTIKRLEGLGNGGNALQLSPESEAEALMAPNYQSYEPVYVPGQGPVNVKVVDPQLLADGNWELYLNGPNYNGDSSYSISRGIVPTTGSWKLVRNGNEVVYSETNLSIYNEQILEKYGISVAIKQALRPGDDQINRNGYLSSSISYADAGKTWLAGVRDEENRSYANWIRSGGFDDPVVTGQPASPCNWKDNKLDTVGQYYEGLFSGNTLLKGTWTNYAFGSDEIKAACGFGVTANASSGNILTLNSARSVDIVFTSDMSKWTKCVVLEMQDDPTLAEGGAQKFRPRKHNSWDAKLDDAGNPVYVAGDQGKSWFPGYAVDQETGERLNIVFGEDSWLKAHNGADMIWNPTSTEFTDQGNVIFGGKHAVYVLNTKYDQGVGFMALINSNPIVLARNLPLTMGWIGLPMLNTNYHLLPLKDGLIPTETRLRIRVERPYTRYKPNAAQTTWKNDGLPLYSFSTDNLAKSALTDGGNPYAGDKQKLLDQIHAVPNPYYGYTGYEVNRLDTRVRIINLPAKATISIYSLDGTLIRRLTKDNAGVSYIDWDILNAKGLPIASGMYLIHVNADGIGETVLRWFGAMRPIDVTNY